MTKKNLSPFYKLAFLFLGFSLSNCNKPFSPLEVVGSWYYLENSFSLFVNRDHTSYTPEIQNTLFKAVDQMNNYLKNPSSIKLTKDNAFQFFYESGQIASGTYSLDGQILFF